MVCRDVVIAVVLDQKQILCRQDMKWMIYVIMSVVEGS